MVKFQIIFGTSHICILLLETSVLHLVLFVLCQKLCEMAFTYSGPFTWRAQQNALGCSKQ